MPIFALADDRELKIKVYVPASSANKLELGKNVKIYVSSLEQWFTGQISKIYPMVDFMSKRVPVEIKIENPTHKLKI
jgi:multidrug efflux pump subunit AcrA (membrane-fusion protein)